MAGELPEDTWPFEVTHTFAPALLNDEEMDFVEKNVSRKTAVVLRSLPKDSAGVGYVGMKSLFERFGELDDLQEAGELQWIGRDGVKEAINVERAYRGKMSVQGKQNPNLRGKHPTMHNFTNWGKAEYQGPGSDRGRPRRVSDVKLVNAEAQLGLVDFTGAAARSAEANETEKGSGPGDRYPIMEGKNFFECPVKGCNERATFKVDAPSSRNLARARIGKHMLKAKEDVDAHHYAHTENFR